MRSLSLPNGLDIRCQTVTEAEFFYHEIFEERVYFQHGISLRPRSQVLDVGANIGMFSLYVDHVAPGSRILAFEPCPPLHAIARHNLSRYAPTVELHNFGLSSTSRRATFTFYPNSSGLSSCYGDAEEERELLGTLLHNQREQGVEGMEAVLRHADDLLDQRLEPWELEVELRPLSEVIAENGVEGRIDLLKIDVQKSEEDVLDGLSWEDLDRVDQVVLEVHETDDGRLGRVVSRLEGQGLPVIVEQDELYTSSNVFNLFARRPGVVPTLTDRRKTLARAESRADRMRGSMTRPAPRRPRRKPSE